MQGEGYVAELEVWGDGLQAVLRNPYAQPGGDGTCELIGRVPAGTAPLPDAIAANDPYLEEQATFFRAILEDAPELIRSSYEDAAKTFEVTWHIREAAEAARGNG